MAGRSSYANVSSEGTAPGGEVSVATLRAAQLASCALSLVFLLALIITSATDGSPFRSSLLTPWMITTILDYYITAFAVYAVVLVREGRGATGLGLGAGLAIVSAMVCFGSVAVWAYVAHVLVARTRPGDSVAKIILG